MLDLQECFLSESPTVHFQRFQQGPAHSRRNSLDIRLHQHRQPRRCKIPVKRITPAHFSLKFLANSDQPLLENNSFMTLRSPLLMAIIAGLLPSTSQADVRLLTGDSNNGIHQSSSSITDLSADGDLVVFVTGPPVSGSTPGITRGGAYLRKISTGELTYLAGDSGLYIGVADAVISDDGRYVA